MPPLILIAAVGAVAYIGYRSFLKEADRVTAKLRRAEQEKRTGSQGTLVRDPKTGVYSLAKD